MERTKVRGRPRRHVGGGGFFGWATLLYFFNQAVGNVMIPKGIRDCDTGIDRVRRLISEFSELLDGWYLVFE